MSDLLAYEILNVMARTDTENAELLIEKDKTIQLLANALKEAADHIWEYSTGKPPEYDVSKEYLKHKELADKYLDKKIPG